VQKRVWSGFHGKQDRHIIAEGVHVLSHCPHHGLSHFSFHAKPAGRQGAAPGVYAGGAGHVSELRPEAIWHFPCHLGLPPRADVIEAKAGICDTEKLLTWEPVIHGKLLDGPAVRIRRIKQATVVILVIGLRRTDVYLRSLPDARLP